MRQKITTTDLDFEDLHRFLYENKQSYSNEHYIRWGITYFVANRAELKFKYLDLSISSAVVEILTELGAITRNRKRIEINEPRY